ncbi:PAS domain-containing protein [Stenotrophomonas sp. ISL-67]|nr:PAS domain-containing protein [Stenotrophomonas sp. ISL-67]
MDRYQQIVELSDTCIKELDLDGVIVDINDSGLKLLGATHPSQVMGKVWRDFWPVETRPVVEKALAEAVANGRAQFEALGMDFHGSMRDWRVKIGALQVSGQVVGLIAVSSDVTARNAALAAAGVLGASFDAKIEAVDAQLAHAARREAGLINDLRSSHSRLVATNMAYQELEVRHFAAARNLDFALAARRAAEVIAEHAQKGEAVGQLLAGVVHDLNNFLQSATTAIDLVLASDELGARNTDLLTVAESALEQGAEMSQRLVGFARQHPYHPESVELAALVQTMRPLLVHAVDSRAQLEIDTCDSGCCAMVDRNTLERALLNLVVNARDACTPKDVIRITTGQRTVPPGPDGGARVPGEYVTLTVTDTGAGMAPDVLARVFEVYFTTKPPGEGSGLGLPQVHSAVRQAGGFVEIISSPGEGARFELALPRVNREQATLVR